MLYVNKEPPVLKYQIPILKEAFPYLLKFWSGQHVLFKTGANLF